MQEGQVMNDTGNLVGQVGGWLQKGKGGVDRGCGGWAILSHHNIYTTPESVSCRMMSTDRAAAT